MGPAREHGLASFPHPPSDAGADRAKYWFFCAVFFGSLWPLAYCYALDQADANDIPHVGQRARENFIQYIYAQKHKAFAIAPGGAWAWTATQTNKEEATSITLQRCQQHTEQTCVLYSLNGEVVFDAEAWPRLWRMNLKKTGTKPAVGVVRGARFPNLRFKDKNGKAYSVRDFVGKITLVHFWGSWCSPCLREMPVLLKMHKALKEKHGKKIEMILLQVREPFSTSHKWAKKYEFDALPLYDSGVKSDEDAMLKTLEGKTYPDRQLAKAFPTSYVLDRNGNVLFSHKGPVSNWLEYLPFFADAVSHGTP